MHTQKQCLAPQMTFVHGPRLHMKVQQNKTVDILPKTHILLDNEKQVELLPVYCHKLKHKPQD